MFALSLPSWEALLPYLLTCLIIESTPGPNMAFLTIVSATRGRLYGLATVLGVTLGLLIIGLAAAAGLATTISNSPLLYQALRYGGVIYLLWLAVSEWREAGRDLTVDGGQIAGPLSFFRHGLIVNILNPKAGVFYVTILPTFIDPSKDVLEQAITLTLLSILIATLAHVIIISLAGFLKPILDNPKRKRLIQRGLAASLALIALWFGFAAKA